MNNNNPKFTSSQYQGVFREEENKSNIFGAIIIIILFSLLSGLFGYYLADRKVFNKNSLGTQQASEYSQSELNQRINRGAYNFDFYDQLIANLKDKYVDPSKVDDKKLFQGSLKGLVDSVGDRATNYFTAEEYKEYLDSFSGKFEGIGVRMEYDKSLVKVIEVLDNSPAQKEGVEVGYIFYKVDGKDVTKDTIEALQKKVRGEAGSQVKITFLDSKNQKEVEKSITRAAINVESIRLIEKDPETVVLEISRFTEDTVEQWTDKWDQNVNKILEKEYKNIIIDLRGNGGGFLAAAIHAADDFLDKGDLILTEVNREKGEKKDTSIGRGKLKDKKVVILINNGTASASEILSGALKFNKKIKIIGTKSFGKGTVQNTFPFQDGSAIKITTEYWILPDGKHLDNDNAITPDVEIEQDIDQYKSGKDNVLEKAIEVVKS